MRAFAVLLLPLLLAACAEPAQVANMTTQNFASATVNANPTAAGATTVGTVIGGEETDALWTPEVDATSFKAALEQSLRTNGLLSYVPGAAFYQIEANILEVSQPWIDIGFTVETEAVVEYRVYHRATADLWFSHEIASNGSAGYGDAILGVHQRQIALEQAMEANIESFIAFLLDKMGSQASPASPSST